MSRKPSLAPELYTNADGSVDKYYMDLMRAHDKSPISLGSGLPRYTLVVGPSPFSMPRGWEFFLTSPYEGATYISTVLHNAGYPTTLIDTRYTPDPLLSAWRQVMASNPDVVGIATFEDNYPFVRELIALIKESRPGLPIMVGGSLATSSPHIFMQHTQADIVVVSEGEITILELMDSFTRGSWSLDLPNIRGIAFRKPDGEVVRTPPRGQMPDLDSLPRMRLDLWPQYHSAMGLQPQIISSYSRGCKMDCSFCYRTTPQVRAKSPAKLDEDLAWLKSQYGTEFIFFVDLTFSSMKQQTLEVCDVISQHDLRWTCLTRCADVDDERLAAMKKSGADIVLYGVESLGGDILKEARKGNTENITIRAMRKTWENDIRFGGLLIVGLPGETEETIDQSCTWAEENNHITRVKYLSAMPGTSVYYQGIRDGQIKSEIDHLNWLSIEQALYEDEFLNYNGLPEQTLRTAYKRIYDSYQPGPVMDFKHFPEHFEYFHPNPDDGQVRSTSYAGEGWRRDFSSAAPPLVPGSERFTLDKVGAPGMAEVGASSVACGAKLMSDAWAK